ncbi:MAG: hypothetical protein WA151_15890 [Desulfatirhabdiaceae bacterium]
MKQLVMLLYLLCIIGMGPACGPVNLYPNQPLDTPQRHVSNGMTFLEIDKTDAALQEFNRALELDARYSPAFVGMGLMYGRQGDIETGLTYMKKAEEYCRNDEQKILIEDGYRQLKAIKP